MSMIHVHMYHTVIFPVIQIGISLLPVGALFLHRRKSKLSAGHFQIIPGEGVLRNENRISPVIFRVVSSTLRKMLRRAVKPHYQHKKRDRHAFRPGYSRGHVFFAGGR